VQGNLSDDASTYVVNQLTDQYGCRDPKSILKVGDSVWFVSSRGLAKVTGASVSFEEGKAVQSLITRTGFVTAAHFWQSKNCRRDQSQRLDSAETIIPSHLNPPRYLNRLFKLQNQLPVYGASRSWDPGSAG